MDQMAGPLCSQSLSPMGSRRSRNFLKFFFRNTIADRNAQNYISREGSITQNAWNGMSRNSNWKIRLKTLENLEDVVKKRRLQVGTLEGIWTETCDMLEMDAVRKSFLKFMCSLTRAQCEELGLALRFTFFKTIRHIGFEELTLQWLIALTVDGRNIESFEYFLGELLVNWLRVAFSGLERHDEFYFTSALELIELIEKIFIHNSTYIRDTQLAQIINFFCKKICNCQSFFIMPLLSCCEAALKYSYIPKSELMPLVVSLCFLLADSSHRQSTWRLMRIILSSMNAYTVLRILQNILTNFYHIYASDIALKARVAIIRGAVFCVAMALWGSQRIDSLKVSSSIVVPALSEALILDPVIMREVLLAVRRLIGKFGKSLQQLTWTCVIQLLERAVKYVKINKIPKTNETFAELIQIILVIEDLYLQNEYCGSFDGLFQLIESCSPNLPDDVIFRLIDYRVSCIDPLSGDWISHLSALIRKYIDPSNNAKHREKALSVLSNAYYKYRLLYEAEVVKNLMLVICAMIPDEKDSIFQYQMIVFLFDMSKSISLRGNNEIFLKIIQLLRDIINSDISRFVRSDNLEIVACCVGELLNERWNIFDSELITAMLTVIVDHLNLQYSLGLCEIVGSDVRVRFFETILHIQMEASTQQLVRVIFNLSNSAKATRIANPYLIVGSYDCNILPDDLSSTFNFTEFKWTEICKVTIKALRIERSWPVIRKILDCMGGVLECRCLVYSAGETFVNYLVSSIIELFYRFERTHLILLESDEFWSYLCPVLARLINYSQDVQLCKIIVECMKSGCTQAIIACNLAVQVLPEKMAILSHQLLDYLLALKPSARIAISLLELMNDSAETQKFHEFFQEKHFKNVVDVLLPYSDSSKYNVFVVLSVHLVFMRWFLYVPNRLKPAIAQYMIDGLSSGSRRNFFINSSIARPSTSASLPLGANLLISPSAHESSSEIAASNNSEFFGDELTELQRIASEPLTRDVVTAAQNISTRSTSVALSTAASSASDGVSLISSSSANTLAACPSHLLRYGDLRDLTASPLRNDASRLMDSRFAILPDTAPHSEMTLTAIGSAVAASNDATSEFLELGGADKHFNLLPYSNAQEGVDNNRCQHANAGETPLSANAPMFSIGSTSEIAFSPPLLCAHDDSLKKCELKLNKVQSDEGLGKAEQIDSHKSAKLVENCQRPAAKLCGDEHAQTTTKEGLVSASLAVNEELMEMLRLFMRVWRKNDGAAKSYRATNNTTTHADFSFFDEQCGEESTSGVALHSPWKIAEKSVEHWALENSVVTVRLMQRKDIAFPYRKNHGSKFAGDRPLSTSGINLLAKEFLIGNERLEANSRTSSFNSNLNLSAFTTTGPITIESQDGDSEETVKAGASVLVRSNSSPPNPLDSMRTLRANLLKMSTNEKFLKDDGHHIELRPLNSVVSTRPFAINEVSEGFQMPSKFRRRNFSNTQGMRRDSPTQFSPLKCAQTHLAAPTALNDAIALDAGASADVPELFNVEYVQIILRHTFGKESWVMRSYDGIPIDFHSGIGNWPPRDASSFLLHLNSFCGDAALRIPPKENEAVQRSLRVLDRTKPTELHAVGVLYIGEDQSHEVEILANQCGTDRYMKFVRLLGEVVSLDEDPGGLQKGKHGEFTYKYSDAITEIVFLIATLMPNSPDDPRFNAKKSLISNNFVSIVFNESGKSYRLGTVSGKFEKVTIEIVPQDADTVVMSVHVRREVAGWIVMKRAFLPDANAARLLRRVVQRAQLAVNIWRSLEECRNSTDFKPYLSQAVDRLRKIRQLRLKGISEL